jgi:hypothetical protein
MDFKKGSTYTRHDIHTLYFGSPVPETGTGNWTSGYVRVEDELIVFMNIDVPGRTGHNFPNRYDEETKTIEWFGKPNTNSKQPTFDKLIKRELTPHFFARWDNSDPFTYLGVGKIVDYVDGNPTVYLNGEPTENIKLTLTVEDIGDILPSTRESDKVTSFALEKYLEEFIVSNWDNIDLGKKYGRCEEEIEGKRKKARTDTGEIDIFALSKDETEYLVIELKKGRASDVVVGQIQRYMGYVKEEVATTNQNVKGLIIALEDDLKIRRALSVNPDIDFYRYAISFDLIEI